MGTGTRIVLLATALVMGAIGWHNLTHKPTPVQQVAR
jgi:hypothetical protein